MMRLLVGLALLAASAGASADPLLFYNGRLFTCFHVGQMLRETLLVKLSFPHLNKHMGHGGWIYFVRYVWPEALTLMLDHGADTETQDAMGYTEIMRAARAGAWPTIELLLAHSAGYVELFYGSPRNQSSWELVTDALARSKSGMLVGGAKRLYGIVEGGDLAYVEERVDADGGLVPHLSARLSRFAG